MYVCVCVCVFAHVCIYFLAFKEELAKLDAPGGRELGMWGMECS